ncbi:MAG: TssQ family T6SS-associated lipoprotein [Rhodocyclaceae bacterium]|nr:TssQ family T6SS-associated lipoprotein [Rhodocyclaceae bacterium]
MNFRLCRRVGTALIVLLLSACAARQGAAPVVDLGRNWQTAQLALEQGRQRYEQGRFDQAVMWLDEALTLGLRNTEDNVEAHKLAAFIACVQSRPDDCRRHFGELLAIDPDFELARAEVGHPMWGPVFREVKRSATAR